jgi:delta 1-pyrroline-5-carboxylate dehydrogenase
LRPEENNPVMAAAQGPSKGVDMENLSRRKLLASAGVATGAAAIAAAPSVAQAALDHPEATDPSGPPPEETIVAYVRDIKRNEVTVMSGTGEVTYRDPVLVKRLVKAAPASGQARK